MHLSPSPSTHHLVSGKVPRLAGVGGSSSKLKHDQTDIKSSGREQNNLQNTLNLQSKTYSFAAAAGGTGRLHSNSNNKVLLTNGYTLTSQNSARSQALLAAIDTTSGVRTSNSLHFNKLIANGGNGAGGNKHLASLQRDRNKLLQTVSGFQDIVDRSSKVID